jgi:hypothetical protein
LGLRPEGRQQVNIGLSPPLMGHLDLMFDVILQIFDGKDAVNLGEINIVLIIKLANSMQGLSDNAV